MALTDEGGVGITMPVTPAAYSYGMPYGGNSGGLFGGGDSWLGILFLIALCNGGFGFGGFGGGWGAMGMMNGMYGMDYLYPWLNNSQNINSGFRDQQISTQINGIQNAITSGFGDVQTTLCGGFAGVNATVNGAQNAISQQLYTNQLADLERSFAAQTAVTAGQTALQAQLAQNGYNQATSAADVKYTLATEACNTRATDTQNTTAIINALNNGVQSIKDQLCADKIESKNDTIAQLRSELLYARGQASQDIQTAAIQAGQRALANEVEQYVAPRAIPAYYVQNPNCCSTATPCGCAGVSTF